MSCETRNPVMPDRFEVELSDEQFTELTEALEDESDTKIEQEEVYKKLTQRYLIVGSEIVKITGSYILQYNLNVTNVSGSDLKVTGVTCTIETSHPASPGASKEPVDIENIIESRSNFIWKGQTVHWGFAMQLKTTRELGCQNLYIDCKVHVVELL